MKKILSLLIAAMCCLSVSAQTDDMYFTPKKLSKAEKAAQLAAKEEAQMVGSDRDVDEYNRHGKYWSHYQKVGADSLGNDIIEFSSGSGLYPDSVLIDTTYVAKADQSQENDYMYSRRMSRFDDFYVPWGSFAWSYYPWYDVYYPWYTPYGYRYFDPWLYSAWYGYPYYGWYGPYRGWYSPWGYYGWYGYPYFGYGYYGYYAYARPHRHSSGYTTNNWSSSRSGRTFGGRSDNNRSSFPARPSTSQQRQPNRSTWGGQSPASTYTPSRSTGSFGGMRSGGGFGGGGHVSGGGRFGGRR